MKKTRTYAKGCLAAMLLLAAIIQACKQQDIDSEVDNPLAVNHFYPNSGNAGTLVTIEGEGFAPRLDGHRVTFGGVPGEAVALEEGRLVVRAPEGGQSGVISLNNGKEAVDVGNFTYQSLSISRVDPANGTAGAHIRIYGTGFSSMVLPAQVMINAKPSLIASASDTLLVAEVPPDAGSGPIEVFVDGMSVRGQDFTFQAIRTVKPLTGGAGTHVRIEGEGFETLAADNIVDFNGKRARVLESNANSLLVEAPAEVETGPLAVTINGQRTTGPTFTWMPYPEITEVTPLSGPVGTQMTISGRYFSTELDENSVRINGQEVPITAATDTKLSLILPGGTGSGLLEVVVNDQRTEGPQFRDQNLGILDFTPDNGQGGLEVTITGTGFSTTPSANQVTFNGILAQVVSAMGNELKVLTPSSVTTGTLQVSVDAQVAVASRDFRRTGVETIVAGLPEVHSMTVDASGDIYAISGHRVVKISPSGTITPVAGHATISGYQDGTGDAVRFTFTYLSSIVMDNQQNLYVSETVNNVIRKISPDGTVLSFVNLTQPTKMVMTSGNFIIAAAGNNPYRISANREVTRLAPTWPNLLSRTQVQFAVDEVGSIYFQDGTGWYPPNLGYINPVSSEVESFLWVGGRTYNESIDGIGNQASFANINDIVADGNGNLLVSDITITRQIRKVHIATREVTTLLNFPSGSGDGALYESAVGNMQALTVAPNGDIYFWDSNNGQAIRRIFLR